MKGLQQTIQEVKEMQRQKTIIAIEDRILVLPDEAETQTKGGIIIPDSAKDEKTTGLVLAVGTNTLAGLPPQMKKGDRVTYSKYAGNELEIEGFKVMSLRHNDIAVVTEISINNN